MLRARTEGELHLPEHVIPLPDVMLHVDRLRHKLIWWPSDQL